jgi:amino-acid N-acetyltransferase
MSDITIRLVANNDFAEVLTLLTKNGLPQDGLADHVATTLAAYNGEHLVGSAALELYGDAALLRSVAVAAEQRGRGLGQQLTEAALDLARQRGVATVYLLTETAADFFPRFGFHTTTRDAVPQSLQQSIEFTEACPASAQVMMLSLK